MGPILALAALLAVRDSWPPLSPAPEGAAWQAECLGRRQALTCVCMVKTLQRSGEGQYVLAMAEPGADADALLTAHGIAAGGARAFRKASKISARDALAACR